MYVIPEAVKQDARRRWALPDRVFFACGACHVLAHAFLAAQRDKGWSAMWIKPAKGFIGNHIVAVREDGLAFDYHGYTRWPHLLAHEHTKANRWWPGWHAEAVPIPAPVLTDESESREFGRRHGGKLWLRAPRDFLHDATPRAEAFVARYAGAAADRMALN